MFIKLRVNSIDSDDANSIAKLDDVDTYRQNATLSTYDLVTSISTDEEDKSSSNIGSNGHLHPRYPIKIWNKLQVFDEN